MPNKLLMNWLKRKVFTIRMSTCDRLEISDCCWRGRRARLNELLQSGLDPNNKPVDGIPLLNITILGDKLAESEKILILQLLLEMGASLSGTDTKGASALMISSASQQNDIVDFLLGRGANPNQRDRVGDTALFYAASAGNIEATRKLLAVSANVNHKNNLKRTPLMWAAREGYLEIVRLLVDASADIGCVDDEGIRLIRHPAFRGHKAVTEFLLARRPEEKQFITLSEAVSAGLLDLVNEQLASGSDLNERNVNGLSALDLAILYARDELVSLLLNHVHGVSDLGHALGVATLSNSVDTARKLIQAGADINFRDETGSTPLMLAAEKNFPILVELLLEAGAGAKLVNENQDTAVDLAQRAKSYDALQMIFKYT